MSYESIKKFEELLRSTKRENIEDLIEYIRATDMYEAPASTRFHLCCEGGLLEHSLNVYENLKEKIEQPIWKTALSGISEDTIIIVSLLHDLCKTSFYEQDWKNQKNYDPAAVANASPREIKRDNAGVFIWESVPIYKVNDQIPYGHGEKSVMMIEEYIKLTPMERFAIRWHMGFSEPKENWNMLGSAIEKYPLILALSESDLEATYITEVDK